MVGVEALVDHRTRRLTPRRLPGWSCAGRAITAATLGDALVLSSPRGRRTAPRSKAKKPRHDVREGAIAPEDARASRRPAIHDREERRRARHHRRQRARLEVRQEEAVAHGACEATTCAIMMVARTTAASAARSRVVGALGHLCSLPGPASAPRGPDDHLDARAAPGSRSGPRRPACSRCEPTRRTPPTTGERASAWDHSPHRAGSAQQVGQLHPRSAGARPGPSPGRP